MTKTVRKLTNPDSRGVPVKTPQVPKVEVPKVEVPKLPDPPASLPDPGGVVSGATGAVNGRDGRGTGAVNGATGAATGAAGSAAGAATGAVGDDGCRQRRGRGAVGCRDRRSQRYGWRRDWRRRHHPGRRLSDSHIRRWRVPRGADRLEPVLDRRVLLRPPPRARRRRPRARARTSSRSGSRAGPSARGRGSRRPSRPSSPVWRCGTSRPWPERPARLIELRGVAQPGSARRSGRRGPRFESGRPDVGGSGAASRCVVQLRYVQHGRGAVTVGLQTKRRVAARVACLRRVRLLRDGAPARRGTRRAGGPTLRARQRAASCAR